MMRYCAIMMRGGTGHREFELDYGRSNEPRLNAHTQGGGMTINSKSKSKSRENRGRAHGDRRAAQGAQDHRYSWAECNVSARVQQRFSVVKILASNTSHRRLMLVYCQQNEKSQ